MKHLLSRSSGQNFRADQRGNVAMVAALAMVPLTLASMGAIDLTRSVAARVELQDALDAAALAAGRSSTQDQSQLQQLGSRILQQNLSGVTDFALASSSFTFGEGGKIVASAQATYHPTFSLLAGGGDKQISASTEVMRANSILEIALVLDNTGSMDGDKIKNLRNAATKFVGVMKTASDRSTEPKAVQISLVPFSNTVRVGDTYSSATWMDLEGKSPINNEIFTTAQDKTQQGDRWAYFKALDPWRGCVEMRQAPYDVQDDEPVKATPATLFTPMFAPDEIASDKSKVNDYLTDPRDKDKNISWWTAQGDIAKYTAANIKVVNNNKVTLNENLGPNKGCGMQPIQRLTTNFDSITTAISNMKATGETNIPNGLLWGWLTLSPKAPFSDGVAYLTPKHRKIVVLMTDGDNTMIGNDDSQDKSTYSAAGFVWQGRLLQDDGKALTALDSSQSTRTAAYDSRMKLICANMKKADVGIEIYAVGVGVSSNAKKLLKQCASGDDHYFDVTGTDMTSAFQSVANQISQIHLSK